MLCNLLRFGIDNHNFLSLYNEAVDRMGRAPASVIIVIGFMKRQTQTKYGDAKF